MPGNWIRFHLLDFKDLSSSFLFSPHYFVKIILLPELRRNLFQWKLILVCFFPALLSSDATLVLNPVFHFYPFMWMFFFCFWKTAKWVKVKSLPNLLLTNISVENMELLLRVFYYHYSYHYYKTSWKDFFVLFKNSEVNTQYSGWHDLARSILTYHIPISANTLYYWSHDCIQRRIYCDHLNTPPIKCHVAGNNFGLHFKQILFVVLAKHSVIVDEPLWIMMTVFVRNMIIRCTKCWVCRF